MKGTLRKTDDSWVVEYKFEKDLFSSEGGQIPIYRETFDMNANQPIIVLKDGKEVEFELLKVFLADETKIYAKLIKSDYPELEGTLRLCEEISKKRFEISDDEINEMAIKLYPYNEAIDPETGDTFDYNYGFNQGFKEGAKWIREQYIKK